MPLVNAASSALTVITSWPVSACRSIPRTPMYEVATVLIVSLIVALPLTAAAPTCSIIALSSPVVSAACSTPAPSTLADSSSRGSMASKSTLRRNAGR